MSQQQHRIKFIQSAITLLRVYRFDGINLHWRNTRDAASQQEKQKLIFTLLVKVGLQFIHKDTQMLCWNWANITLQILLSFNCGLHFPGAERGLWGWGNWLQQTHRHCLCLSREKNNQYQLWRVSNCNVKWGCFKDKYFESMIIWEWISSNIPHCAWTGTWIL